MKKKFFAKLFSAIMAIFFTFGTTACGNNFVSGGDDTDTTPPATEPSDTQKPDDDKKPENPEIPDHFGENADFRYLVKGNQVTIIKWLNETATEVIIPEIIEGKPVTAISGGTFSKCSGKTIEIPDSITYINYFAFVKCDFEYNEKENLKYLGNSQNPYLFLVGTTNKNITTATIDENCRFIGIEAFSGCRQLTDLKLSKNLTSICGSTFEGCNNIKYNEKNGLKYLGTSDNPYFYLAGTTNTEITTAQIDENCKIIGAYAFFKCDNLADLAIPDGVVSIETLAFYDCGLQSISIPGSVTNIAIGITYGANKLTSICIAEENAKYQSIKNCIIETATKTLIAGCGGSTIPVNGKITSFGDWAFYGCDKLTSITIPDSVTVIGDEVFKDCSNLTSITIPNSLISIGMSAFSNCINIKKIYYKGNRSEWNEISIEAYGNNNIKETTIYYYREPQPTTIGNFWHYNANGEIEEW